MARKLLDPATAGRSGAEEIAREAGISDRIFQISEKLPQKIAPLREYLRFQISKTPICRGEIKEIMTPEDQQTFQQRIEEEIAQTQEDILRFKEAAAPVSPDKALGRLTRMESLNDQGISNMALSRAQEKLYQLEQALERVKDPNFGSCVFCGNPIPVERLIALPESTRCVRCAS